MVDFTRTYTSWSTKNDYKKNRKFCQDLRDLKKMELFSLRYLVVFHSGKKVGLGSCYLQKYDYYGQNVKAVDDKSKFTSVANLEEVDLLG